MTRKTGIFCSFYFSFLLLVPLTGSAIHYSLGYLNSLLNYDNYHAIKSNYKLNAEQSSFFTNNSIGACVMETIPLYDKYLGNKKGLANIILQSGETTAFQIIPVIYNYEIVNVNEQELFQYAYNHWTKGLKYYDLKNGYYQILCCSVSNGVWISSADLEKYNIKPVTWIQNLIQYNKWQIFGYHNYRLRKKPDINSQVIIKLDRNKHIIWEFTGKIKDSWAETVIYEVKQVPEECYSDEDVLKLWTKKKYKGWLKVLDDNGQPSEIGYYLDC